MKYDFLFVNEKGKRAIVYSRETLGEAKRDLRELVGDEFYRFVNKRLTKIFDVKTPGDWEKSMERNKSKDSISKES